MTYVSFYQRNFLLLTFVATVVKATIVIELNGIRIAATTGAN